MLRAAAHHAKQALTVPQYYGRGLLKVFTTDPVFLWAQAIAFKTLVTLLPLILLAVGIFGQVLQKEDAFRTVAEFLRGFLPPSQSDGLVELVLQLQAASGTITTFGAVFFIATVVTMFATLRYVVGAAMGESRHQMRTIVGGYLFDIRMVVQVGSLFLLSFAITTVARVLSAQSGALASRAGLDPSVVGTATSGLLTMVTFLVPYVLTVGMLAQLYYFVPRPRTPVRSSLAGAAVAAILFELAKNGFTYYATYVADFDRYADSGAEGLGGLGGAFGLILAFVFWVYLSGLILVAGAVVAALHERRLRPRKSRLRKMWSQKAGEFRKHRQRVEAEAAEAVTDGVAADGSPSDQGTDENADAAEPADPSAASGEDAPGGDALPERAVRGDGPVPASS